MPSSPTLWNLFSKSKGAPSPLSLTSLTPKAERALACFSVGGVLCPLALMWWGMGVGASLAICLLSASVEGFLCLLLPFLKESVAGSARETLSTDTEAEKPPISILSSKQLEVFEVLFGAYSSEPLCQRGIFIIKKKKKLAVVHLAELNSKVIRVVYAFLIKSSFETDVRIKWYNTINIHGR